VHFNRLRLSGFKSFVDPTELMIEPGLTGIVGPNGCGKSNLLEALRWVMGENRAKSMRGSGMDDVIFAGTDRRPARNLAEVSLNIDNTSRTAPAAFNDEIELEISRRIERQSGSAYRLNSKDVRAKDIQLLFADAATGAHSPALVSQGRIGALINAKPKERRAVLEDAAGISGLHSRRNEAERRLQAAEDNLTRLGDIEQQLQNQIRHLKRQATQAEKYKDISGQLRQKQALLFLLEWQELHQTIIQTEQRLREAEQQVAAITTDVSSLSTEQAVLTSKMPDLRQAEAEAAAKLHRLTLARDGLDAEEERLRHMQEKLTQQLAQTQQDESREQNSITDMAATLTRLEEERDRLRHEQQVQDVDIEALALAFSEQQKKTLDTEWALEELTNKLAQYNAKQHNLQRDVEDAKNRSEKLKEQKSSIEERLASLHSSNLFTQALKEAQNNLDKAEQELLHARQYYDKCEKDRQQAEEYHLQAREDLNAIEATHTRLHTEIDGLAEVLNTGLRDSDTALFQSISATPGYEAALGAALDGDLEAPLDEDAPIHWRKLPPLEDIPTLPTGATPLANFVSGPELLHRRLAMIGVMENADQATALMPSLLPGQRLVTRDGGLWRWDGFCASPEAPTAAAIRLSQQNRLKHLHTALHKEEQKKASATAYTNDTAAKLDTAQKETRTARDQWRNVEQHVARLRRELTEAEKQSVRHQSEESALKERLDHLSEEEQHINHRLSAAQDQLKDLPQSIELEQQISIAREQVERERHTLSEARLAHDGHTTQHKARENRLAQIDAELDDWQRRRDNTQKHLQNLSQRQADAQAELKSLADRPGEIVLQRRQLNTEIDKASVGRQGVAQRLAEAENHLSLKDAEIRKIQEQLAQAREQRARAEASLEQQQDQKTQQKSRIREEFNCNPLDLRGLTGLAAEDETPDLAQTHADVERLKLSRDRMGPVNLRADTELKEFEEQLSNSISEREDLDKAITRLRQAISSLNKEGRERMLKAFDEVNSHFKELFTLLFGGGEAHLTLTESDDPLDAGLEIMASPPGKKLQHLSLLSGGEQALTALSLIFAVFMTNPSPICVLDEVDAPLDDANVERFCALLHEMTNRTETRFLIVTHNAITMSQMRRLYGVTMVERGVSQLVSVDLDAAEKIRDGVHDSLAV